MRQNDRWLSENGVVHFEIFRKSIADTRKHRKWRKLAEKPKSIDTPRIFSGFQKSIEAYV